MAAQQPEDLAGPTGGGSAEPADGSAEPADGASAAPAADAGGAEPADGASAASAGDASPPPTPTDQLQTAAGRRVAVGEAPEVRVPALLAGAAAWCWRILVVAGAFLALVTLLDKLQLLVLPLFVAILLSALLHPPVDRLRRWHWPSALATTVVLLAAFLLIGAVGFFVVNRASAQYPQLVNEVNRVVAQSHRFLRDDLHVSSKSFTNVTDSLVKTLRNHQSTIASGVITAGKTLLEFLSGGLLAFFLTFFLLYDGKRIFGWVLGWFPVAQRPSVQGAANRAWRTLSGYVAGTFIVALFHGTVIAITLELLHTPLAAPLAVLVFIGSFIPIIGSVVFGGLALLVTLVTKGYLGAVIVLAVLLIDSQAEAHLLQPLVVGRYVELHPLAIAVALAGGALLAGLPGAIFAVPIVAAANAAIGFYRGAGADPPAGTAVGDE